MAGARLLIRVNELSNSDVGSLEETSVSPVSETSHGYKLLSWECNAAELDKLSLALTGCLYIDDSLGSQLAGRSTSIWGTLAEDLLHLHIRERIQEKEKSHPAGRIL
eukprot:766480-Hanusia_phi.AAC.8